VEDAIGVAGDDTKSDEGNEAGDDAGAERAAAEPRFEVLVVGLGRVRGERKTAAR